MIGTVASGAEVGRLVRGCLGVAAAAALVVAGLWTYASVVVLRSGYGAPRYELVGKSAVFS